MFGNKHGFSKNQKVYVPGLARYGNIRQFRGGLIRVEMMRGEPKEVWVHPHEIEDGR